VGVRLGRVAELRPVPEGALEVIPDDLLPLHDPLPGMALDPVSEALVELGACLLGRSGVCRLLDQQVVKAEGVLTG
jgi:hypothetical protein